MLTMTFGEDIYLVLGTVIVFAMIIIVLGTFIVRVRVRLDRIERKLDAINKPIYCPCHQKEGEKDT
jgi:uncharacterized membrane protein YciS (DUF1049 family)